MNINLGISFVIIIGIRGPVYGGVITRALSPDGHEIEMRAPYRGLMKNKDEGTPVVGFGSTLNISISLEASGELSGSGGWASDTADPSVGYSVAPPPIPALSEWGMPVATVALMAVGVLIVIRRRSVTPLGA